MGYLFYPVWILLREGRERHLHVHLLIQVFAFYTARRRPFFNCNAAFECRRYLFKERGARYVLIMLDEKQKKVGVIAASAGKSFRLIALPIAMV
jgi:hypothetical protein